MYTVERLVALDRLVVVLGVQRDVAEVAVGARGAVLLAELSRQREALLEQRFRGGEVALFAGQRAGGVERPLAQRRRATGNGGERRAGNRSRGLHQVAPALPVVPDVGAQGQSGGGVAVGGRGRDRGTHVVAVRIEPIQPGADIPGSPSRPRRDSSISPAKSRAWSARAA